MSNEVILIITHDPKRIDCRLEDEWEFMEMTGMVRHRVDEPETPFAPARTVIWHRPWKYRDYERFEEMYGGWGARDGQVPIRLFRKLGMPVPGTESPDKQ